MANITINVTQDGGVTSVPVVVDEDQMLPTNTGAPKRAGDVVVGDHICVLSGDPCVEVVA